MEGLGSDLIGIEPLANTRVHLLGRFPAKGQKQDLIRCRFTAHQQPARAGHQHRCLAAARSGQHQQRLLAIHHRFCLGWVKRGGFNAGKERRVLHQHFAGVLAIMCCPAGFNVYQPALALLPRFAAVIELIKTGLRQRQRRKGVTDPILQARGLLAGEPPVGLHAAGEGLYRLLQHPCGHLAHLAAPCLPVGVEMLIELLGLRPLGTVQAHHFGIG